MSTLSIAALRLRASLPALLALALVVTVAVIALGTTAGFIQHGVAAGSRVILTDAAAQSQAVRVTTHLADDSAGQDAAARALFDRLLPVGTVSVTTSQVSLAVPVLAGGTTTGATAVFARVPDLAERAEVTDGVWPAAEDGMAPNTQPVAVQADAAAALGLSVGDDLTVGSTATPVSFQVAALWRATDPTSSTWFADSAATAGRSGGAAGLFVVPDGIETLPTQHFAVWTLSATPAAAADASRASVVAGLERLADTLDSTPNVTVSSSSIEGTLTGTLERIDNADRAATAIGVSALFIVGMVAIVAVLQVSTVLIGSRRQHALLLRARGLSRPQNAVLAIGEGLLVALPAAVIGLAGTGIILSVAIGSAPLDAALAAVPFALGVCLMSVLVLVVSVLRDAPGTAARGRSPVAAFTISFGTIAVAAALATWQLHAQGTPVKAGTEGGADLVTATSPALVLIAIAALGTVLFLLAAPLLSARASGRGTVVTLLADAQLGGRASRYLVPILAIAITVASAAFATGIATTWQSAQLQAQLIGIGPSVSVALRSDNTAPADTEPVTAARFAGLPDATDTAATLVTRVSLGADSILLVAVRPDAADRLLGNAGGAFVDALRTTSPLGTGLEVPTTATTISAAVAFGQSVPTASFAVSIWAADSDGSLARIPVTNDPGAGDGTGDPGQYSGDLPAGVAPWRVVAVEAERSGAPDPAVPTLTVSDFGWESGGGAGSLEPAAEVTLDIAAALPRSRAPIAPAGKPGPLPVVLTTALADRVGLAVGGAVDIGFGASASTVDATVSAIVDALPGAASRLGIGTDLAALNDATLRQGRTPGLANTVWIDSDNPDAVSAAATTVAGSTAVLSSQRTTTAAPVLQPAVNAFWLAAAAAGLLALITLAAFIADDARGRRWSLPVLAALGISARQQVRARARELLLVLVFALGTGAVAGLGATWLAVAPFARAAVTGAGGYVSVLPALAVLPWLGFTLALAVGAMIVIGSSLWLLRRVPAAVRP